MPLLAGCSLFDGDPRPGTISWTLEAEPGVNPDVTDRPSPIWVRVYQLRSVGVFGGAAFQPLFDGDIDVLGAEMLQRYEYVLSPNQVIDPAPTPTELHEDARYIGVVAAYHDIDRAFWRDTVEVASLDTDYTLRITLDRLALRLDLVEE
jgi:type VI secretion system protein VasD